MRTLVVGGTGPSGVPIVRGLTARGDQTTVLHTGVHEVPLPESVEHVHTDPRDLGQLRAALAGRTFDRVISTSGRVRYVAEVLACRVDRFVAISGLPAYAAFSSEQRTPPVYDPVPTVRFSGPFPLREDDPVSTPDTRDHHAAATARSERVIMEAHRRGDFEATILRYTMVYGAYTYIPFEWYLVRRVLDGRRQLALECDGLMMPQRGYGENLAHGVLLALDAPAAVGEIFNLGDDRSLSARGVADEIAAALGHEWEIVSIPLWLMPCDNPFTARQNTLFDMSKARTLLGYADVVPVGEATRLTARWLRDHPPVPGGWSERQLGLKAFDYAREDRVIELMRGLERAANEQLA
jgi:nucleoside-diphosphate-sugar epimerase